MAMWGVGTMLGPITGPTLGGWLTDEYSWRWVFYINLPVGILCAIGLMILIKNKASDNPRPFDLLGFTLLSIAIGTFQLMLDRGETGRLVRLQGDRRRGGGGRRRRRHVRDAHAVGRSSVPAARPVQATAT